MKYYAIIVAGGKGSRMGASQAKQFMLLEGLPILMHTLKAFQAAAHQPELLLVLNIDQHQYWENLCKEYQFDVPHQLIKGGEQRYHSVKNGLKSISGNAVVAIHDAVRPLVTPMTIDLAFEEAERAGNAVLAVAPADSVRLLTEENSAAIDRDQVRLIQTPQVFQLQQLKKAYQEPYRNEFTDDASVVERAGFKINLIPGERENIKITFPIDLDIASILFKKKASV